MRNLDSERIEFNLLGLWFAYLFILIIAPIVIFSSENSCEIVEGFQKGVFYTDANRIWAAITFELILGCILVLGIYLDAKDSNIANGRLVVLDYIKAEPTISSFLFQYLNAKSRLYFVYPIFLFCVSFLGTGIFRCVSA